MDLIDKAFPHNPDTEEIADRPGRRSTSSPFPTGHTAPHRPSVDAVSQPPPPDARSVDESRRIAAAQDLLARYAPGPVAEEAVATVQRAVAEATDDRARLRRVIADLQPDRVTADLKAALRGRTDPTADDTPRISALRRRYESVNRLQSQLDSVEELADGIIAELEALAAETVAARTAGTSAVTDEVLQRLADDATALAAAHREVEQLG